MKRILALMLTLCVLCSLLAGCTRPTPPAEQLGLPGAFVATHLKGMDVGYVEGLTDPEIITEKTRGAKLKKYDSVEDLVSALKKKKLYAIVLPQVQASTVLAENTEFAQLLENLTNAAYCIPNYYEGTDSDEDILMQVDATLSLLKGTDAYQILLDRYIFGNPDDVTAIELNEGDTGRTLTVGVYTDFKPFAYKSKTGNLVGFAVEFVNAVAANRRSDIEFFAYDDADALYADSKAGKVDLAIGPFVKDPEAPDEFAFSAPYFDASQVALLLVEDTGFVDIQDVQ
ncbi:MAG: transporter substrate-binding domain-containing protein [Oscillospiraceae bacterium]|nr:transporter substrate-binding domain-containing protein [Oscillospiraceae bacterium]